MIDISNTELRRIDVTVLLVFLGMLRHRKATDVAAELGLTQSGVSQALKRLRDIFSDELFLRRPYGMEPTAIALGLEAPITAAIESLRSSLGAKAKFLPASAVGVIRMAALDAEQANIVPRLVRQLMDLAPKLQLSILPLARREAMQALSDNEIDLAIGYFWDIPDSLLSQPLYKQDFVVVGKSDVFKHRSLSLKDYARLSHILVSPSGDLQGVADEALRSYGLSRKVIASVPQFFPALAAVAATGCVATLPRGLAEKYSAAFKLVIHEPPLELRSFLISALRHRRNQHDQRLLWILDTIKNDFDS